MATAPARDPTPSLGTPSAQATQHVMTCSRELPRRKYPKRELEASEEKSPDKGAPVSKQEKQLLIDCLTTIIR